MQGFPSGAREAQVKYLHFALATPKMRSMNTALSPIESQFATTDEADAYDAWFREKVEKSVQLADEPNSIRIPHDEVMSKARPRIEAKIKENAARRLA